MNILKTFNTFEDGINEVVELVSEVKKYVGEELTEEAVIQKLIEQIKDNAPSIYNPEYPATYAFSITAREVGFKTRNYLAFGWRINIEDEKVTYSFRVTLLEKNKFSRNNKIVEALTDRGWRKVDLRQNGYQRQQVAATTEQAQQEVQYQ